MMRTSKIFVTVDAVIIRKSTDNQLLLIKRKNEPFQNCWALPGGFVDENEDLEVAAKRELEEETQIKIDSLQQFGTFGKPFRDPRGHMISVAYFGEVPENTIAIASDDAKEVAWFAVNELPNLAFDHQEIIEKALKTFKI
ncbi:NUDIX hydrolase [Flavobacterium psychrophilum]|nr:NUDIX hydrolase [Flavobacterium psychrophilum]EKT3973879.1 NUDIX hydrolase [Flavobacterium psychrophilum]EKT4500514.1 NUDIX hydrolase [Flavobacterium psychrophilum]EKT4526046.1 NUDIX hydrolase [Flavobacterium psychrophilum]EKT4534341.1 NUDIX hydrolase [Flavobacterium psychrophilum]EKT4536404.1 NUDIX hydrolase [Flavobacterium psychrophilum]